MKHIILSILLSFIVLPVSLSAQHKDDICHNFFTIGFGGGYRINSMRFTHLSPTFTEKVYSPHSDYAFSIFGYKEFGVTGHFAVRPQMSFIRRGARLVFYDNNRNHWGYSLYVNYNDFRLPVVFNFTAYSRRCLQPYAYLTPIVGIAAGGRIALSYDREFTTGITAANIAPCYFGLGGALGVRCNTTTAHHRNLFFGIEAIYDHGLSNTYSRAEKDGKVNDVGQIVNYEHNPVSGQRLFSGIEFQVFVGISISQVPTPKTQPPYMSPKYPMGIK
ncbi:MAG: outer membrane beta-barrel protein [Bacteroidales bacterium]|nr:outer membrane beta-barrel protein [Bacteroidales bacterium]